MKNKKAAVWPPGPKGRRLVGNGYDYDADRIGFLRRCQAEYGDVFSFSGSTIVIFDPELVHEVLDKSNDVFIAEVPLFASAKESARLEQGIDGWMRSRKVAWPAMTRSVTRAHGERIIGMLDAALRSTAGQEFDVMLLMRRLGAKVVADFLFGPGAEDTIEVAEVRSELAVRFMNMNLTIPQWLPLPSVRRALRAEDRVIEAISDRVRDRRANPHAEPSDMLDLVLDDSTTPLRDTEIIDILEASILASFGSPGSASSWLIRELAVNERVRERLRDEALAELGTTGTLADDSKLPYSKAVVKEILRMYPPVWLMGRNVKRPCTLGGWDLTPGQSVMFSPYLIHRDPRWWTDPEQFQPERWLQRATPERRRAYLPFGSGPRICLGLQLGMYQLAVTASHLAANYLIESPSAEQAGPDPYAILLPAGLRARVIPIDDAEPAAPSLSGATTEVTR